MLYYKYQDTKDLGNSNFNEFGITDTDRAVIVNGHIPVEKSTARIRLKRAEALSSLTAASQSTIKNHRHRGYTLVYDSRGLYIVAHEPFVSFEKSHS